MMQKKKMNFKDIRSQMKTKAYYNHPNDFGKEGEDHINIWFNSDTRLGKLLDPGYLKTINYNFIGKFSSVQNLWHWIRSTTLDDSIRRMNSYNLRMYASSNGHKFRHVPNFKAIIGSATWYKIKGYKYILEDIKNLDSDIKFLSYYVMKSSGLRVCSNYATMMIEIANIIVDAVKNDKEPDFTPLCDAPEKTGLRYLEAFLEDILPPEKLQELLAKEKAGDVTEEEDYEAQEPTPEQEIDQESGSNSASETLPA